MAHRFIYQLLPDVQQIPCACQLAGGRRADDAVAGGVGTEGDVREQEFLDREQMGRGGCIRVYRTSVSVDLVVPQHVWQLQPTGT